MHQYSYQHDILPLLVKRWSAIDEVLAASLDTKGNVSSVLGEVDTLEYVYGCGRWGCAYPTLVPGWALKITADPTEGPVVYGISKNDILNNHPGVAHTVGVWRLKGTTKTKPIYVILREDITPVSLETTSDSKYRAAKLLDKMMVVARRHNKVVNADSSSMDIRKSYHSWLSLVIDISRNRHTTWLADFMYEFENVFNAVLADIHIRNVGYRTHSLVKMGLKNHKPSTKWVAFDLGNSLVEDLKAVPVMKNPDGIPEI